MPRTSEHGSVKAWLESNDPKSELLHDEVAAVRSLVGHEGFGLLLALLGAERQGCYLQLSLLNLEDKSQRRMASVTQGKIEGLERVRQAVLELFPSDDPHLEEQST